LRRSSWLRSRWRCAASAVSYEEVLIPLVAIVLAWWLQDEEITWAFLAGSVLVLLGVYVGALRGAEDDVPMGAVGASGHDPA
jgi:drug/metabolite transporter (DMT)-like permease